MTTLTYHDETIMLDPEGYLTDYESWTEKTACALADNEGIAGECPLDEDRMDILRFIRDYYKKFEAFPIVRAVCKRVGQPMDCQYQQFPDPVIAWKIAGLPRPTPEVLAKIKQH